MDSNVRLIIYFNLMEETKMNEEIKTEVMEEQTFEVETTSNTSAYENYSDEDKTGFDIKSGVEGGLIALAAVALVKGVKWCAKKAKDSKLKKEEQILAKAEEISKKRKTEEVVDVDEDEFDDCDFEEMSDEEIETVQEEVKKPEKKKK